ncbi:DMT family transporter [Desulfitobacterium metallireducens]|uniref:Transporter n=1 Tax=Desulfitobacterium metallireducens DSM 15288 TaxID=871968 RepID=W0EBV4_9FIRM|nr:DMT family transporter [Desulfitobacterium metallireducens]AHF06556.1 transporter [Desulfitobacterium metallireducens DSM 15288]
MKITKRMANMVLLLISALWGSGFVVTRMALDANVSAGFINFARGLIFALLVLLLFHQKIFRMTFNDFKIGLIAGLLNFGGYIAQTVGVKYTTPSNNAFISATYVVIVPFMAYLAFKKSLKIKSFIAIAFCLWGMAILTGIMRRGFVLNIGDVYSLICAFFYAGSITYISYGARETDATIVAFMLAIVQAIGGLGYFFIADGGQLVNVNWQAAILPLLYMGVMCSFVAQTLQVIAQKHTSATTAGLIMMLEGLFGSLFSVAFRFEPFTSSMAVGGTIIMLALILMEVNIEQLRNKTSPISEKRIE